MEGTAHSRLERGFSIVIITGFTSFKTYRIIEHMFSVILLAIETPSSSIPGRPWGCNFDLKGHKKSAIPKTHIRRNKTFSGNPVLFPRHPLLIHRFKLFWHLGVFFMLNKKVFI